MPRTSMIAVVLTATAALNIAVLPALPGASGAAAAAAERPAARADQLTVTGEGEVAVKPDMMRVRAGVEVRRTGAAQAYDATVASAAKLVKVIVASGIAERDVRTSSLSVRPEYVPNQYPKISGYRGEESVLVIVRNLDRASATLKAIMNVGPEAQLYGVSFDKEDTSAEQAAAEQAAFTQARSRAVRQAALLGRRLGRAVAITTSSTSIAMSNLMVGGEAVMAAGGNLNPGEGTARVTVTATYSLT